MVKVSPVRGPATDRYPTGTTLQSVTPRQAAILSNPPTGLWVESSAP